MEQRPIAAADEDIRDAEFSAEVRQRREVAGVEKSDPLTWGLALSGGGIRSATFCFGLLRALAKNGLLKRFDYLSTVSGGGYIGSMLGRLYSKETPAEAVERGLGSDESLLLWWMRNNGRYLTPAGGKDLAQAAASIFRGMVATHFEVAVLILLAACLITLPHALLPVLPASVHFGLMWLWSKLLSVWWWLVPLPLFGASASAWAYWQARDEGNCSCPRCRGVVSAVAAVGGAALIGRWVWMQLAEGPPSTLVVMGAFMVGLLSAALAGVLLRLCFLNSEPAEVRLRMTLWLRNCLVLSLLLIGVGVLDALAFLLVHELHDLTLAKALGASGFTMAALPLLRAAGKQVQAASAKTDGPGLPAATLANIAGMVLLGLLVLLWTTLLMAFIFAGAGTASPGIVWLPLLRLAGIFAALVLYVLVSGCNLGQLNLASLNYLYLSRLARAYISVGNVRGEGKDGRFPHTPLTPARRDDIAGIARLENAVAGDDPALPDYAPHLHGGPIHLINCCINQTRDDRTGAYNADRKGVALTVSARGMETGTHGPLPHAALQDTTVGQWATISGAALASGMGSKTAPGMAALLFLTGLRLGFWFPSARGARSSSRAGWLAKYRATLAELFASFPGLSDPHWYLSDGGFFDNTGVYALLKRKVDLIVLADCGQDENYLFGDLENLVRKARIDYAAEIEFLDPGTLTADEAEGAPSSLRHVGTPLTITPEPGLQYLLVGRVRYDDGRLGTLLVVKPHRTNELPLDVVAYADGDRRFPQQDTSDQFFDEAQWESYHNLGLILGGAVNDRLLGFTREWGQIRTPPATFKTVADKLPTPDEAAALRRQRVGQTVRTSVGAGIGLTVALGLWQTFDSYRKDRDDQRTQFVTTYEDTIKAVATETDDLILDTKLQTFSESMGGLGIIDLTKDADNRLVAAVSARCAKDGATLKNTCVDYRSYLQQAPPTHAVWVDYWQGTIASQWDAASNAAGLADSGVQVPTPQETPVMVGAEAPPPPPPPPPPQPAPAAEPPPVTAGPAGGAAPPPMASASAPPPQATGAASPQSDASALAQACKPAAWGPVQLFTQIFSEDARAQAAEFGKQAASAGVAAAGIENVTASASRTGGAAPIPWPHPTFIYHTKAEQDCAQALADAFNARYQRSDSVARQLPRRLRATPGMIEFWLPATADMPGG